MRKDKDMSSVVGVAVAHSAAMGLKQWYATADEVHRRIFWHSCVNGAIALIPVPLAGEAACIVNQIAMYRKINELVGVRFSDNVLRNVGKFLLSQCAGVAAGAVIVIGVSAVAKFIPGLNFIGGLAEASVAGAVNYVCGEAYYQMLGNVMKAGGTSGASDAEIIRRMKEAAPSRAELSGIHATAKERMKNANYSHYKKEAQACADAA